MSGRWASSSRRGNRRGSGWDEQAAAQRVLQRDGHRCRIRLPGICAGHATEADHIVPLHLTGPGGDHDANKQAACAPCHRAKTQLEAAAVRAGKSRSRPPEPHPGLTTQRGGG